MRLVKRRVTGKLAIAPAAAAPPAVPSYDEGGEELVLTVYGREPHEQQEKVLAQTEVFAVKKQLDSHRWVWLGPPGLKLDRFEVDRPMWITRIAVSNPKELAVLFKETDLAQHNLPLFLLRGETLTLTFQRELIWITRT